MHSGTKSSINTVIKLLFYAFNSSSLLIFQSTCKSCFKSFLGRSGNLLIVQFDLDVLWFVEFFSAIIGNNGRVEILST